MHRLSYLFAGCLLNILCWLMPGSSLAQVAHFRTIKLEGLSTETKADNIFQDSQDFIWVAGSDGLYRYNGIDFSPYMRPDGHKTEVTAIQEDRTHTLWVGYKDGSIFRLLNDKLVLFSPEEGLPKKAITDILEDHNGTIWFATYGEGLYCYTGGRIFNFNLDDGLRDNDIYQLALAPDGQVWAGTDGGIAICQIHDHKKSVRSLTMQEGLPDNLVMSLAADGNYMWVGTQSMGLFRYNFDTKAFESLASSADWDKGAVECMLIGKNRLWVGTSGNGIVSLDKKAGALKAVFDRNNSPLNTHVTAVLMDNEGNAWVCDRSENLYLSNPSFQFMLPDMAVQALLYDRQGNLWYSTGEKLTRTNPDDHSTKTYDLSVISLYQDKYGYIWLGTFGSGVYRLDPKDGKMRLFTEKDGLINGNVLSIDGKDNEVWFATLGGVSKCNISGNANDPVRFTNFSEEQGLGTNYIYKIFADSKGRLWFGTDGKGITLYDHGQFRNFNETAGLRSNIVYSITEDAEGNIWFSTSNAGLYRYDGSHFTNFSTANGLRDLNIAAIKADVLGNLLIVHKSGIDLLNTRSNHIIHYGRDFGIGDIDPNLNAAVTDSAGNIWLGTQKGIIKYIPIDRRVRREWPITRINKLLVYLKEPEKDSAYFSHDQNHISFDYIGLWYQDPENVVYRIKLEGYDREWSISRNHFITYPSLPPGDYTFKVQSSTSEDFTGAPTVTYHFRIAQPYWNTVWFYLLCLLTAGTTLYLFIKNREHRLRSQERHEKDKVEFQFETLKSQINPHFLFNSFNTLISIIEKDPPTAVTYVEKLSDFYRDILMYREKNLITLAEEMDLIKQYFFLQQKRYRDNLRLEVDIPERYYNYMVAPLTLQMLLENAIKHNIISKGKPLTVRIFTATDDMLVVSNNLQIKKSPERSTGLGLENIRNRYTLLCKKRPVAVVQTESEFSVMIPLIESES